MIFDMKKNILLQCLLAGVIQLLACIIVYLFNIPNPNIVLFVILSATLVQFGYVAGTVTGIIALLYSFFFFSTDNSWIYYTPVNRNKLIVIVLGVIANIFIIGKLQRDNQKAVQEIIRLEIEQKNSAEMTELVKKAESANKAKSLFLANMSHDIRTPLNGIVGLMKIIETHIDDKELVRKNFEEMDIAADHLISLVNDVLQMSRIEDGIENIIAEPTNIADVFREITVITEENARAKNIKWKWNGNKEFAYPYIMASPLHLRQIFLNIYGNSVKFTNAGGTISTTQECVSLETDKVIYRWIISDTGIGMSKEFQTHIFEPFAQEKNDARSRFEGTGLGMPITKHLVERVGGTISVSSEVGRGTTFTVELPFEIAPNPIAKEAMEQKQTRNICGLHILLAEDNELNAEIAEVLLREQGAEVSVASDGKQAFEIFRSNPAGTFDVILMDIMMPVMDGYEATKAIRDLSREDAKKIPIIAVTANAFAEDRQKVLDAGLNDHIAKPIDMGTLTETLLKYR